MSGHARKAPILYAMSAVGSGCGFVTQMLVSGFWSVAYSYDVYHFSINLAFYFLSLGLGSLFTERWKSPRLADLILVTLSLGLWTGVAIPFLRLGIAFFGGKTILPILAVAVAGFLAGTVIPLTLRIGRHSKGVSLSALLFIDYTAAIVFSALFTFVLLVPLGYDKTALCLSSTCLIALGCLMIAVRETGRPAVALLTVGLVLPMPVHEAAWRIAQSMKDANDKTEIVFNRQSHYQKIVLTREVGTGSFFPGVTQYVLYLDGMVQFTSWDEQSYHACISNIPQTAAESEGNPSQSALILGGGDGLVARNLLALPKIKKVTQVELDPAMIEFAATHPVMRALNLDSLRSPRVEIELDDAFHWVRQPHEPYDLVIIDFPHPRNVTLSRLFSAEFYAYVKRLLKPDSFVAIQAGPSINPDDRSLMTLSAVPVSVRDTVRAAGLNAHVYVSTRDEEAFVLATPKRDFDMTAFAKKVGILGMEGMGIICSYNPEWREPAVAVNTLNTLTVSRYMLDWFRRVGGIFFSYKGSQSAFLPD